MEVAEYVVLLPALLFVSILIFFKWEYSARSSGSFDDLSARITRKSAPGTSNSHESCLSRLEQHWYRRSTANYAPSTRLLHQLHLYRARHAKCVPLAVNFTRGSSSVHRAGSDCKFVVWISYEGLGNQLLSLISTFLYALLTQRVLLVDRGTDMPGLLCEPFPGASWFLPDVFPTNWLHSLGEDSPNRFGRLIAGGNFSLADVVYVHMTAASKDKDDKLFFCEDEQRLLSDVPWMLMRSNSYYVPGLYGVSSFRAELEKIFQDPGTVFRHTARYLVYPSNTVWSRVTSYYRSYLRDSDMLVGLQLRILHDSQLKTKERYFSEQVIGCILRESILPNVSSSHRSSGPEVGRTVTVLVASLEEVYYDRLKDRFLRYPTVDGSIVKVESPSHEIVQQTGEAEHDIKALTEIYLLSMCDVLVTSPRSTFGYVAHALGGIKPWTLRGFQRTNVSDPICSRSPSPEPCYLTVSSSLNCSCEAGVPPFVQPCHDDPLHGVQLVNR